ncbi:MAG: VPS10 domain-containing protein [Flavipsychrobacter sp.]
MKKFLLIATSVFGAMTVQAQPWMSAQNNNPVKLSDIIEQHHNNPSNDKDKDEEEVEKGIEKEGGDYQFNRWVWYWKQHLDVNGYLVSPEKTWEEWEKYHKQSTISKFEKTTGTSAAWTFQGPDTSQGGYSGIGRINVVSFHPTDSNTFWVGSPGGGAWKTTNNGHSWTCMTDKLPLLSVSDIDFNPLNPKTVYLCTGDRDGGNYYSVGVLKSYDGGNTWSKTGLSWTTSQYRLTNALLINKLDTNCLLLATSNGIYKSTNGGVSWSIKLSGDFKEVVYNPADTNVLYATGQGSSTSQSQIYRSANGGNSWTQITNFTDAGRVSIAVTPANAAIVKAVVASGSGANANGLSGIYSSSDSGKTFNEIYTGDCANNPLGYAQDGNGCNGQGWYDLCIAISPLDSNKVYIGGVNTWYSDNGGSNWTLVTFWYFVSSVIETAHADKHYMAFNPLRPTMLYQCNDGGVYMSNDPSSAAAWSNRVTDGLGITEFYRNAVDNNADYILGGAQDNGTKLLYPIGGTSASFDVGGGDGMNCIIDFADNSTYYYSFPGGSINIHNGAGDNSISDKIPGKPSGAWVTPFVLMPSCNTCVIAGYSKIYMSSDQGNTWDSISGVLPIYNQTYIERIALTPADANTIYATVDYSDTLYYTHDLGATWNKLPIPYPGVSDVVVDSKNKDHVWVTFSGYNTNKVAEYKPATGWHAMNDSLPNVPVACIERDTATGTLYIGTDIGVYYRADTGKSWVDYNNGLPAVRVNDLGINYTTGEIWAATFGRGMWKSPKQVIDTATHTHTGISIVPFAINALTVAPNPNRGAFTVVASNVANEPVTIRLIDNTGKVVLEQQATFNADSKLQINTNGVAKGSYILDVSGRVNIGRQKVVIY